MFSKKDFQDWGKKDVVLFASVATHIAGRKDDRLLGEYGFGGFPSFAILDAKGQVITKRVDRQLSAMQHAVEAATNFVKLEAEVKAGKKVDKSAWILARLALDKMILRKAKKELSRLELSPKRRAEVDKKLFALELQDLVRVADRNADRASESILKLYLAGKKPAKASKLTSFYNSMLLRGAETAGDGKAFLYAYPLVRKETEKQIEKLGNSFGRKEKEQAASLKKDLADMDSTAKEFEAAIKAAEKAKKKRK